MNGYTTKDKLRHCVHVRVRVCHCSYQNSHLSNQQSRLVIMENNEPSVNNNSLEGFLILLELCGQPFILPKLHMF